MFRIPKAKLGQEERDPKADPLIAKFLADVACTGTGCFSEDRVIFQFLPVPATRWDGGSLSQERTTRRTHTLPYVLEPWLAIRLRSLAHMSLGRLFRCSECTSLEISRMLGGALPL